jgi:hypothetical protein
MTKLVLKESESLQTFQDKAADRPAPDRDSTAPRKRRATGPRTEQGRKRSSRNAIAHGIFSLVVILPGESERLYKKLLRGFVESLQPEGGLEMHLVEKLAQLAWRHRRLLIVEGAEIRLGTEFYARDQEAQQLRDARNVESHIAASRYYRDGRDGLLGLDRNPVALRRCLELLSELDRGIKKDGFDTNRDTEILKEIYGAACDDRNGLFPSYKQWSETAEASEAERDLHGYASPEECSKCFLTDLAEERCRLKAIYVEIARTEGARMNLEVTVRAVPRLERAELLLKYDSALQRDFDRTLSQLERIQRQRRGQPQAPRIDITIAKE